MPPSRYAPPTPIRLAPPSADLVPSYLAFLDALRAHGDTVWPGRLPHPDEPVDAFVARLRDQAHHPAEGMVPHTVWWGVDGADVVGVIVLRHQLTPALARYGGHVSYEVHPGHRRRGVGTALLATLLDTPEAQAIDPLRITCAPDNTGSRRVVEANGGRLLAIERNEQVQRDTCIYDLRTSRSSNTPPNGYP